MAKELMAPQTAAGQSSAYMGSGRNKIPATLMAPGLASTEKVTVEISPDGINFEALVIDGTTQELTANNNALTVFGPGHYRGNKSLTAAQVGVYVFSEETP